MILNGSLRNVEVVLRESFVAHVGKGAREEDNNWDALKHICKDPYLESVTLISRYEGLHILSVEERRKRERNVTSILHD
jgi:hypothetical protein